MRESCRPQPSKTNIMPIGGGMLNFVHANTRFKDIWTRMYSYQINPWGQT